ncbi:MAG: hypothetical protein QOE58_3538, partial [Actinomycetota bacterium]|nr:hypothetical protein [Actinomycetota bacterium]
MSARRSFWLTSKSRGVRRVFSNRSGEVRERTLANMTVPASGVRQQSVWASVVSDDAQALRGWLLALGFTEDLLIPGDDRDTIHHCQLDWPEGGRVLLSSTGERPTPCRPGT